MEQSMGGEEGEEGCGDEEVEMKKWRGRIWRRKKEELQTETFRAVEKHPVDTLN